MKRLAVLACALPLLAGCVNVQLGGTDAVPTCDAGGRTSDPYSAGVVLMAQSVPSASLLPCIGALPIGWSFHRLDATDRSARFWLNYDREGRQAVRVALDPDCDVRGATESASEQPGTRRYERVEPARSGYRGERYYVYPGGCITYHFELHGKTGAQPLTAVLSGLGFVTRDALRQMVHDYSDGRFELDPTAPAHPAPSDSTHG
jgi:hypothetical protein